MVRYAMYIIALVLVKLAETEHYAEQCSIDKLD